MGRTLLVLGCEWHTPMLRLTPLSSTLTTDTVCLLTPDTPPTTAWPGTPTPTEPTLTTTDWDTLTTLLPPSLLPLSPLWPPLLSPPLLSLLPWPLDTPRSAPLPPSPPSVLLMPPSPLSPEDTLVLA